MTAETPDKSKGTSESVKQLLKLYEYINGTIDFDRFARDHNVPTIEAARKRFKRHFAANNVNVKTNGDSIGSGPARTGDQFLPRKPTKRKNRRDSAAEDDSPLVAKKPKFMKTRASKEVAAMENAITDDDADEIDGNDDDGNSGADEE